MKRFDVVLIGSGISSLTAAAILSKKGKSVCVLEQHTKPGGFMHCFNRFGRRFDTGAHYVGAMDPGQPFHVLLDYLGVHDETLFEPLNPDGFDVLNFPELSIEIPKGYSEAERRLSAAFPSEGGAIRSYFEKVREVARNFPTYEFSDTTDMGFVARVLEAPVQSVVESLTQNPALRAVFYSYCTLYGVPPAEASFGMHAIVTDSLIRGPYGLARGGDALTKKFIGVIEAAGGKVLMRKRVASIEVLDRIAQAVVTVDGDRIEADWVISGIHPKQAFAMLSDASALTPAFRERLGKIPETIGLFGMYALCEGRPLDSRRNYYYFNSLDPDLMLDPGTPDRPPNTVFISPAERSGEASGAAAAASTPINLHSAGPLEWFKPWADTRYAKRPEEYHALKRGYAERVLETVARFDPNLVRSIQKYETSTALSSLHFNGGEEGSPYGIYHSIAHTGARALGPRTHVPNLLITGQSTLFPGLLGAAIAGLRTSGHIVGIKPLLKELGERRGST